MLLDLLKKVVQNSKITFIKLKQNNYITNKNVSTILY